MSTAGAILATLRPRQWVKNLFVVAPLVFSKHLLDPEFALRSAGAFASFCALSGAVYAFNDLRDAPLDRQHPIKRNRPIASGALSERAAITTALVLASLALASGTLLSPWFGAVAAGYAVNNLFYTLGLKRIAFLDVLSITGGFLLRVLGGAYAIDVPVSPWLLACTALLAAMLGFGKRAHELHQAHQAGREASSTRASLAGYQLSVLRPLLGVLAIATCVVYGLYTLDERTVSFFHTERLLWTSPFCVIGIARFLQLAVFKPREESPTDAILRDWPFLLVMAGWGVAVVTIIYGAD